jgi:hypothetical protein
LNIFELRKKEAVESGATAQISKLEGFTAEDIILDSYVHTDNAVTKGLIYKYESLVLLSKIDPDKYRKVREERHVAIIDYIKQNNLQKDWAELCYILTSSFDNQRLLNVFTSELMDTWFLMTWDSYKYTVGFNSSLEPILIDQPYGDYDVEHLQLIDKFKRGKIFGPKFMTEYERVVDKTYNTQRNEHFCTVDLIHLISFINDRTKSILPKTWIKHYETMWKLPRVWKPTSFYKELLSTRRYMLDKKGVTVRLAYQGNISEMVFMEQLTSDGKIVMLYRVTVRDKGSSVGYYNVTDQIFFSSAALLETDKTQSIGFENFVLEVYAELVSGLEKDRKRIYSLLEVEDIFAVVVDDKTTHVYMETELYNAKTDGTDIQKRGKGGRQKPHSRTHTTRKLREGMKASEEAIERAKEYNIEVEEGSTYVREYKVGLSRVRKELKSTIK